MLVVWACVLVLSMASWLIRFFLGGNKVLQIALGKTAAEEHKEGLHQASEVLLKWFWINITWVTCNFLYGTYKLSWGAYASISSPKFCVATWTLFLMLLDNYETLFSLLQQIHGFCGLFFTNLPKFEVLREFREFEELDFARTGSIATETVRV